MVIISTVIHRITQHSCKCIIIKSSEWPRVKMSILITLWLQLYCTLVPSQKNLCLPSSNVIMSTLWIVCQRDHKFSGGQNGRWIALLWSTPGPKWQTYGVVLPRICSKRYNKLSHIKEQRARGITLSICLQTEGKKFPYSPYIVPLTYCSYTWLRICSHRIFHGDNFTKKEGHITRKVAHSESRSICTSVSACTWMCTH